MEKESIPEGMNGLDYILSVSLGLTIVCAPLSIRLRDSRSYKQDDQTK